ncbi:hypothetical protein [Rhodococcoides fascians]|uniref:hypothetical protein n=1 Tax=Rhodococcoides fascians TaxID=1828 RepID=UPI00050C3FF4|nr:hypothetical protein [Rhodococcus fascians]
MGTDAWENWRESAVPQTPKIEDFEDELHSDVEFKGGPVVFGPYRLSAVSWRPRGNVANAVVLNFGLFTDTIEKIVQGLHGKKSNTEGYHGGSIGDEIAALVSLELGVRVRSAGTRFASGIYRNDGNYPMFHHVPSLVRPGPPGRELLPRVVRRPAHLSRIELLKSFPILSAEEQLTLVRAARSYSNALWWSNEDPNLAWLQMVTAIETAAKTLTLEAKSNVELFETADPEMADLLRPYGAKLLDGVADLRAPKLSVTNKFITFVLNQNVEPPPAAERPQFDALEWDSLKKHMRTVYKLRSAALHAGTPVPMVMLQEPAVSEDGAIDEVPGGNGSGGMGGTWIAKDTPMLLSSFEYIAREALLSWWRSLAPHGA